MVSAKVRPPPAAGRRRKPLGGQARASAAPLAPGSTREGSRAAATGLRGPLAAGGPRPLGAATRRRVGRDTGGHLGGNRGPGGGRRYRRKAPHALPGGGGRACLPWGQRRARRAPAGRPAARPCARGALCRPAACARTRPMCPAPCARSRASPRRSRCWTRRLCIFAHVPPDLGRA